MIYDYSPTPSEILRSIYAQRHLRTTFWFRSLWGNDANLSQSKSPPRVQQAQQRPILMTRRQLTDPFGSDDEEENIQIIDEKCSQSISITKSQSPVRDISKYEIAQTIAFYAFLLLYLAALTINP